MDPTTTFCPNMTWPTRGQIGQGNIGIQSPMFNAALLSLESQRRRTMPNDAKIHLGHRAVMDLEPYQLEPALQALRQPRTLPGQRRRPNRSPALSWWTMTRP